MVEVFGYGSPPFNILNREFRRRVIEEAASHGLDLVFTFVWDMEAPADTDAVEELVAPYADSGGRILVVELSAGLEERVTRNKGQASLAAKPTKRDVVWSEAHLRQLETKVLNSDPMGLRPTPADAFLVRHPHLRLNTTNMTESEAAELILGSNDQNLWIALGGCREETHLPEDDLKPIDV